MSYQRGDRSGHHLLGGGRLPARWRRRAEVVPLGAAGHVGALDGLPRRRTGRSWCGEAAAAAGAVRPRTRGPRVQAPDRRRRPRCWSAGSRWRPRSSRPGSSPAGGTTWPTARAASAARVAAHPPGRLGAAQAATRCAAALAGHGLGSALLLCRAAGRGDRLRQHGARVEPGAHRRRLRPGRRHLRRRRRAQARGGGFELRRHRRRASSSSAGSTSTRRCSTTSARPLGAAWDGARPGRPGGADRGRRAAPGVHGGQGGALARHRGAGAGAAARGLHAGAARAAASSRR